MESIWKGSIRLPSFAALEGERRADAAVIGGGMAGVLIARELKRRGVGTVVVEASTLASGQTQNTTAKITAQHGPIYHQLIRRLGSEKARQYAAANQNAVAAFRRMVREENIDCDFVRVPSYLYSRQDSAMLEREAAACRSLGLDASFTRATTLPFPVAGAVRMGGQAMFHPLKFLARAAEELEVYEHSPVLALRREELILPRGRVSARHIILASHYPFVNFPGLYFARMHQERSYVAAIRGAAELDGMYYGVDEGGLSFRGCGPYLLVGGGGHRTGKNPEGGRYDDLAAQAASLWPGCTLAARWSAQDCATLDGVPYIGVFSPTRPNWYVATGFGKWGMTASMVAAGLIADQICGVNNPLAPVFSPRRFSLTAAEHLALEGGEAVKNLTKALLDRPGETLDQLPPGHGGIVTWQGKKVGAYREENGALHIIDPKCPHLGCQLSWNPDEKSWDCPCHGSRFDMDGKLLNNPAQRDL